MPITFVVCFVLLFNYIGLSFVAGLGVFLIAFLVNTAISRLQAILQKVYMKLQDKRVTATTEALNNIKMLKLYSWTETFLNDILNRRRLEMDELLRKFHLAMFDVASLYFFPQVLSAVVFSVYIGSGHTLDLGTAYTVMTCLNIMKDPMREFPK